MREFLGRALETRSDFVNVKAITFIFCKYFINSIYFLNGNRSEGRRNSILSCLSVQEETIGAPRIQKNRIIVMLLEDFLSRSNQAPKQKIRIVPIVYGP